MGPPSLHPRGGVVEESMLVPKLLLHHAPPTGELGHNIGATISGGGPTRVGKVKEGLSNSPIK